MKKDNSNCSANNNKFGVRTKLIDRCKKEESDLNAKNCRKNNNSKFRDKMIKECIDFKNKDEKKKEDAILSSRGNRNYYNVSLKTKENSKKC